MSASAIAPIDDPTLPSLTVDEVTALDDVSPGRFCPPEVLLAVRQIVAKRSPATG